MRKVEGGGGGGGGGSGGLMKGRSVGSEENHVVACALRLENMLTLTPSKSNDPSFHSLPFLSLPFFWNIYLV